VRRAEDTGEYLLRLRASRRAVSAAAHLASYYDRPQGLLSAPVGGVQIRIDEKAEQRRQFDLEVPREALDVVNRARISEQIQQLVEEVTTRDIDAVCRNGVGRASVPYLQRVLQNARDPRREAGAWMIALKGATPPEEMPQTRLMERVGELPIRRPAIAPQAASEITAEHRRGIGKAAAAANAIDRRGRGRKDPQPVQQATDFPAGFIRHHDAAGAHGLAEGCVGWLAFGGGAVERPHDRARRHREVEARAEHRRDFPERQPELFVQAHRQRDRVRAYLHGRGAKRVRGLERMASLDAALTATTAADMNVKAPYNWLHRRQVFLKLRGDMGLVDVIAALRTVRGQWRVMPLVHDRGNAALAMATMSVAGLPSRSPRSTFRRALRERRRLSRTGPPRGFQLVLQARVFSFQPRAFLLNARMLTFGPFQLLTQARVLAPKFLNGIEGLRRAPTHACVMPEFPSRYKSDAVTRYSMN